MIILKYENLKKKIFYITKICNYRIYKLYYNIYYYRYKSADDRIELSIQDHESRVLTITLIHRKELNLYANIKYYLFYL